MQIFVFELFQRGIITANCAEDDGSRQNRKLQRLSSILHVLIQCWGMKLDELTTHACFGGPPTHVLTEGNVLQILLKHGVI